VGTGGPVPGFEPKKAQKKTSNKKRREGGRPSGKIKERERPSGVGHVNITTGNEPRKD